MKIWMVISGFKGLKIDRLENVIFLFNSFNSVEVDI